MTHAISHVGRAVFNGGFTTFMGMGILSCGPGKPFYGFGALFCYMVALGLYHGLLVLPVVLSWVNPKSIADAFKIRVEVKCADGKSHPLVLKESDTIRDLKVMLKAERDHMEDNENKTEKVEEEIKKMKEKLEDVHARLDKAEQQAMDWHVYLGGEKKGETLDGNKSVGDCKIVSGMTLFVDTTIEGEHRDTSKKEFNDGIQQGMVNVRMLKARLESAAKPAETPELPRGMMRPLDEEAELFETPSNGSRDPAKPERDYLLDETPLKTEESFGNAEPLDEQPALTADHDEKASELCSINGCVRPQ